MARVKCRIGMAVVLVFSMAFLGWTPTDATRPHPDNVFRSVVIGSDLIVVGYVSETAAYDLRVRERTSTIFIERVLCGIGTKAESLEVHWYATTWYPQANGTQEAAHGVGTDLEKMRGKSALWCLRDRSGGMSRGGYMENFRPVLLDAENMKNIESLEMILGAGERRTSSEDEIWRELGIPHEDTTWVSGESGPCIEAVSSVLSEWIERRR